MQVNSPNSQDKFQIICCTDMYLVQFLVSLWYFVFLWILRDDLLEIHGTLSTPNSRKVRKKKRKTDDTIVCMFDNSTKHQLIFHEHFFFWSPLGNFRQNFSSLLFFSPWQPKWSQQLERYIIYWAQYLVSDWPKAWLLRVIMWSLHALCCS